MNDNISTAFAAADASGLRRYVLRTRADQLRADADELAKQADAKRVEAADLIGEAEEEDERYEKAVLTIVESGIDRATVENLVESRVKVLAKVGLEALIPPGAKSGKPKPARPRKSVPQKMDEPEAETVVKDSSVQLKSEIQTDDESAGGAPADAHQSAPLEATENVSAVEAVRS